MNSIDDSPRPARTSARVLGGAASRGSGATLMGNGLTTWCTRWPRVTEKCSQSTRASMARSTVSRKLLQWYWVWKPIRSAPSMPCRISDCQGQMPKASKLGHGMCQKIATRASGRASFT